MAYVWKHPKSRYWTACYRDEKNRWRKKTTKKKTKTAALGVALEWERASQLARDGLLTESKSREIISGILERTTGESLRVISCREYSKQWLNGKTRSRQQRTTDRYTTSIDRFLDFLGKKANYPITAVTPLDCQRFYDHLAGLELAPASLVVEMKTIGTVFNAARRLGLITNNPINAVELPGRIKQVQRSTFTSTQVGLLLREADDEWKTTILLGYYGGLRLSDAISLTWENVDLVNRAIILEVSKTGQSLEIPLHPELENHLNELAGDSNGPLCPTLASVAVGGRSGLSKQFLAIMAKAGISNNSVKSGGQRNLSRLSFHALRSSFNSSMANAGVPQETRMKLTGHKSKRVNDRYTQTERETLRLAIQKIPEIEVP